MLLQVTKRKNRRDQFLRRWAIQDFTVACLGALPRYIVGLTGCSQKIVHRAISLPILNLDAAGPRRSNWRPVGPTCHRGRTPPTEISVRRGGRQSWQREEASSRMAPSSRRLLRSAWGHIDRRIRLLAVQDIQRGPDLRPRPRLRLHVRSWAGLRKPFSAVPEVCRTVPATPCGRSRFFCWQRLARHAADGRLSLRQLFSSSACRPCDSFACIFWRPASI